MKPVAVLRNIPQPIIINIRNIRVHAQVLDMEPITEGCFVIYLPKNLRLPLRDDIESLSFSSSLNPNLFASDFVVAGCHVHFADVLVPTLLGIVAGRVETLSAEENFSK